MIDLTLIVATRDRPESLERLLGALVRQTLPLADFEVVVGDNGSRPDTLAVVERARATLPPLQYIAVRTPGLHAVRHAGARVAQGRILVFTDDDVEPVPGWLSGLREGFRQPRVALVGGPIHPRFESPPPSWLATLWRRSVSRGRRVLPLLSLLELGDRHRRISPFFVWGCNLAVRREVFEAAHGFHPDAMPPALQLWRGDGETWLSEFVAGAGYAACYRADAGVYHAVPPERLTREYWISRAALEGISDSYTLLRNRLRHGACGPQGPCSTSAHRRRMAAVVLRCWARRLLARCQPRSEEPAPWRVARARAATAARRKHRDAVQRNPDLAAWVARDDYLNE